jgi:hypothetical protein
MSIFNEWVKENSTLLWSDCDEGDYLYMGVEVGWGGLENKVWEVIEELEDYPTSVSVHLKSEHAKVTTALKVEFIKILRERLL